MLGISKVSTMATGGGFSSSPTEGSWNIDTVSYASKSVSVTSQESTPTSLFFKSDGTKLYVAGTTQDRIYQYNLTTAWDVTTASYASINYNISAQEGSVNDMFFKSDGTKLYLLGFNNRVYQHSLSTAWDLTTITYDSVNFLISQASTLNNGLFFAPDGTKMYALSANTDIVYQYDLSTAWNVGSAVYNGVYISIFSQTGNGHGLWFKTDGTKMYITGKDSNTFFQYNLSTAWNVSTATYATKSYDATSQDGNPSQIYIRDDALAMYMLGNTTDTVYQYSMT